MKEFYVNRVLIKIKIEVLNFDVSSTQVGFSHSEINAKRGKASSSSGVLGRR